MRALFRLSLVAPIYLFSLMFIACGGGGSGDGSVRALSGTWVSACFPSGDDYKWGKYVFNGQAGELEVMLEVFQTSDCSDTGVIQSSGTGTYKTGNEIECPSGSNGKCTELDLSFDGDPTKYTLYSIFAGEDPDHIFLSGASGDPANRPDDVILEERSEWINIPFPDNTGEAIIGLTVIDGSYSATPPTAPAGYTTLPIDLNGGTLGTYV